jgi:molybdopterin-guanine dinucleotide biosynthesis protein A
VVLAPAAPAWATELRWVADADVAGGPAAGLLAALQELEKEEGAEALLLTAPVDAPLLPLDLFDRLEAARRKSQARAAIARHGGGLHPVFGVWQAGCAGVIRAVLREEHALHRIAARAGATECEAWEGQSPDPFTNLNSPEDVAAAEAFLRRL